MLYEARLSTGGTESKVSIERVAPFAKDDTFRIEMDMYQVTEIGPGHDEFDAVVFADWIGRVQPDELLFFPPDPPAAL